MLSSWLRIVRASARDARLILRESGPWLLAFVAAWLGLGLLVWQFYRLDGPISLAEGLYIAFTQMLFETRDLPQTPWLQPFFFVAPAVGLFLIARGALNAGLLLFDKRNRREAWQAALASTYRDHVIVCGLDRVGFRVVGQLLDVRQDVVAIEPDAHNEFVDQMRARGVPVLIADARQAEAQRTAGVERARAIIGTLNNDLTNLNIALTARTLNPTVRVVLRIFNEALAAKLEPTFGIKTAFSTSALAAPTFAAAALVRNITNAIYVGGRLVTTQPITVAANGGLDQRIVNTIEQLYDVSVLYRRNAQGEDLRPRETYRLSGSDQIVVTGTLLSLDLINQVNVPGGLPHEPEALRRGEIVTTSTQRHHIIVAGLSRVGYRVVQQLIDNGQDVVGIELPQNEQQHPFAQMLRHQGVTVITGDPSRLATLHKAGLDQAHALVCVVGDDLLNLNTALTARAQHPDIRVVLRIFNDALAEKLEPAFGIKTTFSTSALAAPTFAAAALSRDVTNALTVGGKLLTMQHIIIRSKSVLEGQLISRVEQGYDVSILYRRNADGDDLRPRGDEPLCGGDHLTLVGTLRSLEQIAAQNEALARS